MYVAMAQCIKTFSTTQQYYEAADFWPSVGGRREWYVGRKRCIYVGEPQ